MPKPNRPPKNAARFRACGLVDYPEHRLVMWGRQTKWRVQHIPTGRIVAPPWGTKRRVRSVHDNELCEE